MKEKKTKSPAIIISNPSKMLTNRLSSIQFSFAIMFDILIGQCTLSNKHVDANTFSITSDDYRGLNFVSNCMKIRSTKKKQINHNVFSIHSMFLF